MNTIFWISWRYLWARRSERFVSLLAFISIIGIAIGVAALIVVLAVMSGFDKELKEKILGNNPHITIDSPYLISDYGKVMQDVTQLEHVVASSPFVQAQVLIQANNFTRGIIIRGVDMDLESEVTKVSKYLVAGDGNFNAGIFIGKELAYLWGIGLGDSLLVVTPEGQKINLKVTGLFNSGMYDYDTNIVYVSLAQAQEMLGLGNSVNAVGVKLDKIFLADEIKKQIAKIIPPELYVHTWMERNKNFFAALKLEKMTMFIILTLIVLVAAFNIVSTLVVMVTDKIKDIGILKAIGMSKRRIRMIFTIEGLMISSLGIGLGMGLGFFICYLLDKYQFIKLPSDIYYLDKLPVSLELWPDVGMVLIAAFLISLFSTVYPAKKAAGLSPIEGLRYE